MMMCCLHRLRLNHPITKILLGLANNWISITVQCGNFLLGYSAHGRFKCDPHQVMVVDSRSATAIFCLKFVFYFTFGLLPHDCFYLIAFVLLFICNFLVTVFAGKHFDSATVDCLLRIIQTFRAQFSIFNQR